jgi:hypothetical protein
MKEAYARKFEGTVKLNNRVVRLSFSRSGDPGRPGFIVTSDTSLALLLKPSSDQTSWYQISRTSIDLTQWARWDLEQDVNNIIQTRGLRQHEYRIERPGGETTAI